MVLKNLDPLLTGDLLKALYELGHGDVVCIADSNFPAASTAKAAGAKLVRLDGHSGEDVLRAVMSVFPLDKYSDKPMSVMAKVESDAALETPIWSAYATICSVDEAEQVERFAFYAQAKKAQLVIATGETAKYANIMLVKGCV
jgi:L-fucose mutarotase